MAEILEIRRCRHCGAVLADGRRCCRLQQPRALRADELAAWLALESEGALTPEERCHAVAVRCGMDE